MLEIVETTMFYFNDRPVVHSKISGLPFMVSLLRILFKSFYLSLMSESNHLKGFRFFILYFKRALQHNMPHRNFFCCLLESNQGFINRTGWVYSTQSPINMPFEDNVVLPAWENPWLEARDHGNHNVLFQWPSGHSFRDIRVAFHGEFIANFV